MEAGIKALTEGSQTAAADRKGPDPTLGPPGLEAAEGELKCFTIPEFRFTVSSLCTACVHRADASFL